MWPPVFRRPASRRYAGAYAFTHTERVLPISRDEQVHLQPDAHVRPARNNFSFEVCSMCVLRD